MQLIPARVCLNCGATYERPARRDIQRFLVSRFCSTSCGAKYRQRGATGIIPCAGCGEPFMAERRTRKYCSRGCAGRHANPASGEGARYKKVKTPGGWMHEHRYVMEQTLGRKLRPFENVHHKNGNKRDNRPRNLELWLRRQPAGQRVADLIAFLCEHYREEVRANLE